MGEFETGTGQKGYASEGFEPEGGVTRIQTGKKGSKGRVLYKKGKKVTRTKEEQPKEYSISTPTGQEVKVTTEPPEKQIIKVAVDIAKVEEINKQTDAKELTKALIEGRVRKTKEGYEYTTETKRVIPEEEEREFYTPRNISPEETTPHLKEEDFSNLLKIPTSTITAAKPSPKPLQMKDILTNPFDYAAYELREAKEKNPELLTIPFIAYNLFLGAEKTARTIITEPQKIPGALWEGVQQPEFILGVAFHPAFFFTQDIQEATSNVLEGDIAGASQRIGSAGFQYGIMKKTSEAVGKATTKYRQALYESEWATLEPILSTGEEWIKPEMNYKYSIEGTKGIIIPEEYLGQLKPPEVQTQVIPKEVKPAEFIAKYRSAGVGTQKYVFDFLKTASTEQINIWLKETEQLNFPKIEKASELTPEQIIKIAREEAVEEEFRIAKEKETQELLSIEKAKKQGAISTEMTPARRETFGEIGTETEMGGGQFQSLEMLYKKKKIKVITEEEITGQLPPQAQAEVKIKNWAIGTTPRMTELKTETRAVRTETEIKSRTISGIEAKNVITERLEVKPITEIKGETSTKPSLRTGGKGKVRSITETIMKTEQISEQKTELKQEAVIETKLKSAVITKQMQLARTQPKSKFIIPPKPRLKEEESKKGKGFGVFVRRGGVFRKVRIEKEESKAIKRGLEITKQTAAASFKIISEETNEAIRIKPPREFRESTRERGVIIQKNPFRISSAGEKMEITAKGIAISRARRRKTKWEL